MESNKQQLPPAAESLIATFGSRRARVGVIGLGYVGLPLAVALAEAGHRVTGVDLDPHKVEAIRRGESYIEDTDTGQLAALVKAGRLTAETDFASLRQCHGVSICVPPP